MSDTGSRTLSAAADPDATVVRAPPDDPDATVVRVAAADPDATVVRAPQPAPQPSQALPQLALAEGYRLHEYRIEAVLGQGGFGITYLATDVNLAAPVAIKEYLPAEIAFRAGDHSVSPNASEHRERYRQGLEAFLVEARTLASFRHGAIVRVARFFEAHRTAYMVLEYERGQSLRAWWAAQRTKSEARLVERLAPLLDGLAQVHAGGVLHRDIKPDNIQVRAADGSWVLLDFGSAGQSLVVPEAHAVIVTPGYAPPEQYGLPCAPRAGSGRPAPQGGSSKVAEPHLLDGAAQGPWTDIYALGATLYWLVSGRKPPDAELRLHGQSMPSARELGRGRYGEAFLGAIDTALALDPRDRPQHVDALRQQLFADHLGSLGLQEALRLQPGGEAGAGAAAAAATRLRWPQRLRRALTPRHPAAWPLATKLTLAFVLTALLPMALAGFYNLRHSLEVVTEAEVEGLEQLAQSVAARLAQLVAGTRNTVHRLAGDPDVAAHLARPEAGSAQLLRDELRRLVRIHPELQSLLLIDRDGKLSASSDGAAAAAPLREPEQVRRALAGEPSAGGLARDAATGAASISFAEPVRDEAGSVLGAAVLRLRGVALSAILDEVNAAGLTPMLVSADGTILHHPREDQLFRPLGPLPAQALRAMRGESGSDSIGHFGPPVLAGAAPGAAGSGNVAYRSALSGVDEVAGFAPVKGQAWIVAVSETRASFEAPLQEMQRILLASLALVGLLFSGLASHFARGIVRPLQALAAAADALKAGDYDAAHVDVPRRDELGQLARTFNVMVDVLRQREREGSRRE